MANFNGSVGLGASPKDFVNKSGLMMSSGCPVLIVNATNHNRDKMLNGEVGICCGSRVNLCFAESGTQKQRTIGSILEDSDSSIVLLYANRLAREWLTQFLLPLQWLLENVIFIRREENLYGNNHTSGNRTANIADVRIYSKLHPALLEGYWGSRESYLQPRSLNRLQLFLGGFPLSLGNASIVCGGGESEYGSDEGTPHSPFYRYLGAVLAIAVGGFLSYRLLVLGDYIFKPDWLNVLLLLLSFAVLGYGAAVVLYDILDAL